MNLKSIVCPIEFSSADEASFAQALSLARWHDSELHVLHVRPGRLHTTVTDTRDSDEPSHARLVTFVEARNRDGASVAAAAVNWCEVDSETVSGMPHEAIHAVAAARKADLIVMGLPRRQRLAQLVAGSTVKRVLRRAACPVLIVPGRPAASASRPDPAATLTTTRGGERLPWR